MNTLLNWYRVSLSGLDLKRVKKELTIKPKVYGDEEQVYMEIYRVDGEFMYVPYDYGVKKFGAVEDKRTVGKKTVYKKFPNPNHYLAPEGQDVFMSDLLEGCVEYKSFTVSADTGVGKTVSMLNTIARTGIEAIVVVPTNALMSQWREQIKDKLGVSDGDIGYVTQDTCDYIGKKITIASMQSLVCRDYGEDFYKYHGFVCFDEADRFAAQKMSQIFGKFHARIQIPMSATLNRKDGRSRVLKLWYGETKVVGEGMKTLPIKIIPIEYRHEGVTKIGDRNQAINYLSRCIDRNEKIAGVIDYAYRNGKVILAIGDSVKQIQRIDEILEKKHGIPREEKCIFADQTYTKDKKMSFKGLGKSLYSMITVNLSLNNNNVDCFEDEDRRGKAFIFSNELASFMKISDCTGISLEEITNFYKSDSKTFEVNSKNLLELVTLILKTGIHEIETRFQKSEFHVKATKSYLTVTGAGVKKTNKRNELLDTFSEITGVMKEVFQNASKIEIVKKKTGKKELEGMLVNEGMRVYQATYGQMRMGIDVRWIDFGIDITPRSEGIQVIGRVARRFEGKEKATWVTIIDTGLSDIIEYINRARLKDYTNNRSVTVMPLKKNK